MTARVQVQYKERFSVKKLVYFKFLIQVRLARAWTELNTPESPIMEYLVAIATVGMHITPRNGLFACRKTIPLSVTLL